MDKIVRDCILKQLRAICDELLLTDKEAALALDGIIELIECKRRLEEGTGNDADLYEFATGR